MYNKEEILQELRIQLHNIDQLYNASIINQRGITRDTKEKCTEVIAEELLKLNIKNLLGSIKEVERKKGYRVATHDGVITTPFQMSNRKEERCAIELFKMSKGGKVFNHIGKILDYQIPLKNSRADKGLGKIDLISINEEQIFIIELKNEESKETLLRCFLEIATYYQVFSKTIFLESYRNEFGQLTDQNIKKAILIYTDSLQYREMEEIQKGKRSYLQKLMDELEVQVYCIDESLDVQRL